MISVSLGSIVWYGFGVVLMYVLWRAGIAMLRSVTMPTPAPPPPGEMRRVNMRFRCDVCGVELKLTMAPDEDPPPPKHCLEDMIIVAPTFE